MAGPDERTGREGQARRAHGGLAVVASALFALGGCALSHLGEGRDAGAARDARLGTDARVVADAASPPRDGCVAAAEVCDGLDSDCDGLVDDDAPCSAPHATAACVGGTCVAGACDAGFEDCNGEQADGCEVETATDRQNCGGCGVACGLTEACAAGVCERERIVDVALGGRFGCVLLESERVLCWGTNESGALTPEYPPEGSPVPVEIHAAPRGLVQLGAGDASMYGLARDGSLWAWGGNLLGELGIGRTSVAPEPPTRVLVDEPVVAVDAPHGADGACAVTASRAVLCWGQRVAGSQPRPTAVPLPAAARFVTGQHAAGWFAVTDAGAFTWGDDRYGLNGASPPTGLDNPPRPFVLGGEPVAADCGCHCCALLASGSIACWGSDYLGALGNGPPDEMSWDSERGRYSDPVAVDAPAGAVEIVVIGSLLSDIAACARYPDGSVWCWGGPLANGLGHVASSAEDLALPPGGASAIFGGRSGCALSQDRTQLRCWGANWFGELGDGSVDRPAPTPVSVVGFE